jgi:hypothetical protein
LWAVFCQSKMLTHAGFAVRYKSRDWMAEEMGPTCQAVAWPTLNGRT